MASARTMLPRPMLTGRHALVLMLTTGVVGCGAGHRELTAVVEVPASLDGAVPESNAPSRRKPVHRSGPVVCERDVITHFSPPCEPDQPCVFQRGNTARDLDCSKLFWAPVGAKHHADDPCTLLNDAVILDGFIEFNDAQRLTTREVQEGWKLLRTAGLQEARTARALASALGQGDVYRTAVARSRFVEAVDENLRTMRWLGKQVCMR